MAADAQTSGGLLLAIPREKQPAFAVAMRSRGQEYWIIGEVKPGPARIKIVE
jgi:selenophosphate synthase